MMINRIKEYNNELNKIANDIITKYKYTLNNDELLAIFKENKVKASARLIEDLSNYSSDTEKIKTFLHLNVEDIDDNLFLSMLGEDEPEKIAHDIDLSDYMKKKDVKSFLFKFMIFELFFNLIAFALIIFLMYYLM